MSNNDSPTTTQQKTGTKWTDKVCALIDDWLLQYNDAQFADVVISPDVDGVLSVILLQRWLTGRSELLRIRVIGVYTTTNLIVLGDATMQDCRRALWIDHDVLGDCRSIGNHLIQLEPGDVLPGQHPLSFNLNQHIGQTFKDSFKGMGCARQDKYPFGTAHLLAHSLLRQELDRFCQAQPYHSLFVWLAHADGAWLNAQMYQPSARQWHRDQFGSPKWMQFLFDGYLADDRRFERHNQIVAALQNKFWLRWKRASSSGTSNAHDFLRQQNAQRWLACRGNQGLDYRNEWSVEKVEKDWLPSVRQMFDLVAKTFGTSQPAVQVSKRVSKILYGRVFTPNPIQMALDQSALESLLKIEGAFSLAFVSRNTLRYTVDLPGLTSKSAVLSDSVVVAPSRKRKLENAAPPTTTADKRVRPAQ